MFYKRGYVNFKVFRSVYKRSSKRRNSILIIISAGGGPRNLSGRRRKSTGPIRRTLILVKLHVKAVAFGPRIGHRGNVHGEIFGKSLSVASVEQTKEKAYITGCGNGSRISIRKNRIGRCGGIKFQQNL